MVGDNMQRKGVYIFLLVLMLGIIGISIVARNQMLNTVSSNKKYIDEYVSQYDGNFIYEYSETLSDGSKQFYYKSEQYPDFVLVVNSKINGDGNTVTDNYKSLSMQQQVLDYWKDFFGENVLLSVNNCENLNILSTIDETISYNSFELNVGLPNNSDIVSVIENYIVELQQEKIDCSVYFYYLNEKDYNEYATFGFDINVDRFDNYTMVIIRNGEVDTKIQYQ